VAEEAHNCGEQGRADDDDPAVGSVVAGAGHGSAA
jgi:hypothetical protein